MNNKEVHKTVKKRVGDFLRENGFAKQDASSWVRSTEEIIQMIYLHFSYGQESIDIKVVLQPWCIPEDMIYLTISSGLSRINNTTGKRVWGSYDEKELNDDIDDILLVLKKDAFALLDKTSDCLSLCDVIKTTGINIFCIDPMNKARLCTYMYFYKHRFKEACIWNAKYCRECEGLSSEEIKSDLESFARLDSYLRKKEYEKIDEFFKAMIEENVQKFNLKCKLPFDKSG